MKRHPAAYVWFKFHAKDLSLLSWIAFRVHAGTCADCRRRLGDETRERSAAEALFDDRVTARLRGLGVGPTKPRPARAWIAVSATAVALALFMFVRPRARDPLEGEDGMREKGGASTFLVYVATPSGTDLLGERCRAGDALQAQYRTPRAQVVVIGVDPEGVARALVPLEGTTSTPTAPGLQSLPQSWVLDAAPGRERFVAFFSDVPIDAARAREAAKQERPTLAGASAIVRECRKDPR